MRHGASIAAIALLATLDLAATAPGKETIRMVQHPTASRPPPPHVAPVEAGGVRYEQDLGGDGPDGLGGGLLAKDANTGATLWRLQVYRVADESAAGVDRIGRYFRHMTLAPGGASLRIEDETGGHYTVDLQSRSVTSAPAAPQPPAPAPAGGGKPAPE